MVIFPVVQIVQEIVRTLYVGLIKRQKLDRITNKKLAY